MDLGLAPDEWLGIGVVGIDEVVDLFSELFDRGEGFVAQGLSLQDRESDLHLIEP
jgi:hypothetical protein